MADSFVDKLQSQLVIRQQALSLDRHSDDRCVAAAVFLQLAMGAGLVHRRLGVPVYRPRDRRQSARLFRQSALSTRRSLVAGASDRGIRRSAPGIKYEVSRIVT